MPCDINAFFILKERVFIFATIYLILLNVCNYCVWKGRRRFGVLNMKITCKSLFGEGASRAFFCVPATGRAKSVSIAPKGLVCFCQTF